MELIKKEVKFTNKEFCWKSFVTTQLTDYLTKHSILLFKIKQWTPRVPLMLKTLFVSLEPKNVDFLANFCQKLSSFKMIQIDCVHRILFCSSHSVLCKVSSNMELQKSVSYSLLTLNKPLGSCKVRLAFTLGSHSRVTP